MSANKGSAWQQGAGKKGEQASGFFGSTVLSLYSATKHYIKDPLMNSSLVKYQVSGANFKNEDIPDGLENLPLLSQGEKMSPEEMFSDICYSGCNFSGARVTRVLNLENTQFLNCTFDKYTNFILLAYESRHGHEKVKERITNGDHENGNEGGEGVILTVADANALLKKSFIKDGVVDDSKVTSKLKFLEGLIRSVTILDGGVPIEDHATAKSATRPKTQILSSELQAIKEFKALSNKLTQKHHDELEGAFPKSKREGGIGYFDAEGYYDYSAIEAEEAEKEERAQKAREEAEQRKRKEIEKEQNGSGFVAQQKKGIEEREREKEEAQKKEKSKQHRDGVKQEDKSGSPLSKQHKRSSSVPNLDELKKSSSRESLIALQQELQELTRQEGADRGGVSNVVT